MPLNIAFIGYNTALTRVYFRKFAQDNAEQVRYLNAMAGIMVLHDNTTIWALHTPPVQWCAGRRFDQIIVADDRCLNIFRKRADDIGWVLSNMRHSVVAPEFQVQLYDIDAEGE